MLEAVRELDAITMKALSKITQLPCSKPFTPARLLPAVEQIISLPSRQPRFARLMASKEDLQDRYVRRCKLALHALQAVSVILAYTAITRRQPMRMPGHRTDASLSTVSKTFIDVQKPVFPEQKQPGHEPGSVSLCSLSSP